MQFVMIHFTSFIELVCVSMIGLDVLTMFVENNRHIICNTIIKWGKTKLMYMVTYTETFYDLIL